jgi:sulfur relay (sulfurtransferase) DsrC/TusE family protein
MSALVDRFEAMRLANFLQHRCDWNETVIRQFYATLEISMVDEKFWWKTRKRTYYATFAQFTAANELDYGSITNE